MTDYKKILYCFLAYCLSSMIGLSYGYPIDGYEETHIRRLQFVNQDLLPAGAKLPLNEVIPSGQGVLSLPVPDPVLSAKLKALLGEEAPLYSVAILDISVPGEPRFLQHNPDMVANIGSVGKIIVMFILFDQLARLYPDDINARERILRETIVTADDWILWDNHDVPIFSQESSRVVSRRLRVDDTGNLWEYLDWMMSASSNAAASMVIQQIILLEHYGVNYPVSLDAARDFLQSSSAATLGRLWVTAMERTLRQAGFDLNRFRQGKPFTDTASRYVNSTSSVGNTTDLVRLLNLIETEQFVDSWSSREAKRLLYMTQKRIRYASHPVLNDSAVYFKSGSLYSCQPEPGFVCGQYMGNRVNRLASIAVIESPAGSPRLRYMVAVMSNVLRVNSAVAHQTLALRIHRLIEAINEENKQ